MSDAPSQDLLEVVLDSWNRNHAVLVNLLRVIPDGGLEVRAVEGGPSVAGLFSHVHFVRLAFVQENAPELARELPEEWQQEPDRSRLEQRLDDSARAVREAVRARLAEGRHLDRHYDHPILFLQHMIWHEGYHHGQIKLALKLAGLPVSDRVAGPVTWGVWMRKR